MYRALADVLPDRVIADSGGSPALRVQFSGRTEQDEPFALLLFASAGMGASARHDGLPTTAFPTNSGSGSIEALESSAPLLLTRKEFRADSGGAGTHRGGLGQDIEVSNATRAPLRVALIGDRERHPALGLHGGSPGELARAVDDHGTPLPLKSVTALPPGGGLVISFAGGGGYGPPAGRDPAAIAADLREGFVTHEAALRDYGEDAVRAVMTGARDSEDRRGRGRHVHRPGPARRGAGPDGDRQAAHDARGAEPRRDRGNPAVAGRHEHRSRAGRQRGARHHA